MKIIRPIHDKGDQTISLEHNVILKKKGTYLVFMDPKIIELSTRMDTYLRRNTLTKYSIEDVTLNKDDDKLVELVVRPYPPDHHEAVKQQMCDNNPKAMIIRAFRAVTGGIQNELDAAKEELERAIALTQASLKAGKNPVTLEAVTLDLAHAIKNAALAGPRCRIRYVLCSGYSKSQNSWIFLDHKKTKISEEQDALFSLVQPLGETIIITPASERRHDLSEYTNMDILLAYYQNLREGIKNPIRSKL